MKKTIWPGYLVLLCFAAGCTTQNSNHSSDGTDTGSDSGLSDDSAWSGNSDADSDADTDADSDADGDTDSDADGDTDSEEISDSATGTPDTSNDTQLGSDGDTVEDKDTQSDSASDTHVDKDTSIETDSDSQTDADTETAECTELEKVLCENGVATHCGFNLALWRAEPADSCMISRAGGGFFVNWDEPGDALFQKGLIPGVENQLITYEAEFLPQGNANLGVYGWTRDPDVEYYIIENWGDWRPPGSMAPSSTIQSDGGTYEVYQSYVRSGGINTLQISQFWSVRTQRRSSGTVTLANHFNGWRENGFKLGELYEVMMLVEAYQSTGTADIYSLSMTVAP